MRYLCCMRIPKALLVVLAGMFWLALGATAGSLTPPGAVSGTMHSLANLYDSIASAAFDSSAIVANQNGSLLANLKYIENQIVWASGSSNIWNLNAGNVGIGTTNPIRKLHVMNSPGSSQSLTLSNSDFVLGVSGTSLQIATGATTGNTYYLFQGYSGAASTADIIFQIFGGEVRYGGNVGIGVTGAQERLEVGGHILASTSGNVDLVLNSTTSDDTKFTLRSTGASDRFEILGSASQNYLTILKGGECGDRDDSAGG